MRSIQSAQTVRREHNKQRAAEKWCGKLCEVCCERASQQHHILQIQHGGTNRHDNKLWVCTPCHGLIHPFIAAPPKTAPSGHVPYMVGTEVRTACPACSVSVIAVQPKFKKTRYPMAQSKRPLMLNANAEAPYDTTDLHMQHCLNKRGLSRISQAEMGQVAGRDVKWAEGRGVGGNCG